MKRYPKEFKKSIISRLLPPNSESISQVSQDSGVSQQTLRNWIQEDRIRKIGGVDLESGKTYAPLERFRIVVETLSLTETELSDYARSHGLHPNQIEQWREQCIASMDPHSAHNRKQKRTASRKEGQLKHRRKLADTIRKTISTHCAAASNQVWRCDITYLNGPVKRQFYYLYMISDLYSRKLVGWEVWEDQTAEHRSQLIFRAGKTHALKSLLAMGPRVHGMKTRAGTTHKKEHFTDNKIDTYRMAERQNWIYKDDIYDDLLPWAEEMQKKFRVG